MHTHGLDAITVLIGSFGIVIFAGMIATGIYKVAEYFAGKRGR